MKFIILILRILKTTKAMLKSEDTLCLYSVEKSLCFVLLVKERTCPALRGGHRGQDIRSMMKVLASLSPPPHAAQHTAPYHPSAVPMRAFRGCSEIMCKRSRQVTSAAVPRLLAWHLRCRPIVAAAFRYTRNSLLRTSWRTR